MSKVVETKFLDQDGKIHRVFYQQDIYYPIPFDHILAKIFEKYPIYKSFDIIEHPRVAFNSMDEMPDFLRQKESYPGDVKLIDSFTSNGVEHRTYSIYGEFNMSYRVESQYGTRILSTSLSWGVNIMEYIQQICRRHELELLDTERETFYQQFRAAFYNYPATEY